ncbi:tetratricopeptide repeat (TPR)-like superfamily protein [Actinidia rufa]|uniref:Tetratricopeptide repeat (TPR)-like superfamily protein n=1 Tax=Actinidia rufa TaxID=165716 RepID=A0A7J0E5L2_9ERIC|nr:tetratricopeptide repeat (TPR)-like superfamily protein [Actinidia rufa]
MNNWTRRAASSKTRTFSGRTQNSGLHVLDLIDRGALEPDPTLYNKLLNKCTQLVLKKPAQVFDEMPNRDMVTWTALITGYSQNDRPHDALVLFPQMLRLGLWPNQFTFSSLLQRLLELCPATRDGTQIHGFIVVKYGFNSNVYVGSSLVDMYARCNLMDEAQFVFDCLLSKNDVSYNALIAGHARKDEGEHAIRLFWKMQREDFKPTHFTYSSVFSACANIGALEQGKWVHAHMIKSGQQLIAFVGNTLLDILRAIEDYTSALAHFRKRQAELKVVDCRVCGDPNSVLRCAFIDSLMRGKAIKDKSVTLCSSLTGALSLFLLNWVTDEYSYLYIQKYSRGLLWLISLMRGVGQPFERLIRP